MSDAVLEKEVCEKCGAHVRENTVFCYNCGERVTNQPASNGSESDAEPEVGPEDVTKRFKLDEDEGKLAKAAAERKKARVSPRKSSEFVWEPTDDSSNLSVLIFAGVIAVGAAVVVFIVLFWK